MLKVVENSSGLEEIKPIWERLSAQGVIFRRPLWCITAWNHYFASKSGCNLWTLFWQDKNDENSVILPTYIDAKGRLRFIFDSSSDTCDAIYSGNGNRHQAYLEFSKRIKSEPRIKSVWLKKMPGNSEALNFLGVFLRGSFVGRDNAYSWLDVIPSDDFIGSQKHMKSKDRADLKCLKRQSDKFSLRVLSAVTGDSYPAEELRTLRDSMCNAGRRTRGYFPETDVDFTRKIYEDDGCEIAILDSQDRPQAINVILKTEARLLSWVFFYADPKTCTSLYLKYFCERRIAKPYVFDFGVGVYSYKIGTFRPKTELTFSSCYGKSLWRHILSCVVINVRFAKDFIKSIKVKWK